MASAGRDVAATSSMSPTESCPRRSEPAVLAHPTPYDSVALFLTPKMAGYSALDVADLTAVEFVSRDVARDGLE